MESKSKNLISKSKLYMSLRQATKPSSTALQPAYSSKPPKPSPTMYSSKFVANDKPIKPIKPDPLSSAKPESAEGFIIMNQAYPQQTPKIAVMAVKDTILIGDSYGKLESFYGACAEDEAVDSKSANYIARVKERFRVESVNLGSNNSEDSHV